MSEKVAMLKNVFLPVKDCLASFLCLSTCSYPNVYYYIMNRETILHGQLKIYTG